MTHYDLVQSVTAVGEELTTAEIADRIRGRGESIHQCKLARVMDIATKYGSWEHTTERSRKLQSWRRIA